MGTGADRGEKASSRWQTSTLYKELLKKTRFKIIFGCKMQKMRCKSEFMDLKRPTRAAAVRRALTYLTAHKVLAGVAGGLGNSLPNRQNLRQAKLRSACTALQFSTEVCRIPLHIPLRRTVPKGGVQYVLGRVDTLDINGYNNLDSSCMKVLNLGYTASRPGEVAWDIFVNDLFIACSAAQSYAFGQFPVRLVLDPLVRAARSPRGSPRGHLQQNIKRFHHIEQTPQRYEASNALAKFGLRNYGSGGLPTVTVREICQLLHIFGMHLYKYIGPDWSGQYELYFFSHASQVPVAYRHLYVKTNTIF